MKAQEYKDELYKLNYSLDETDLTEESKLVLLNNGNILVCPPYEKGFEIRYILFGKSQLELSRDEYNEIRDSFRHKESKGIWSILLHSDRKNKVGEGLDDFNKYIDKLKQSNTKFELYIEDKNGEIELTDNIKLDIINFPQLQNRNINHISMNTYGHYKKGFDLNYGIELKVGDELKRCLKISLENREIVKFKLKISNTIIAKKCIL